MRFSATCERSYQQLYNFFPLIIILPGSTAAVRHRLTTGSIRNFYTIWYELTLELTHLAINTMYVERLSERLIKLMVKVASPVYRITLWHHRWYVLFCFSIVYGIPGHLYKKHTVSTIATTNSRWVSFWELCEQGVNQINEERAIAFTTSFHIHNGVRSVQCGCGCVYMNCMYMNA